MAEVISVQFKNNGKAYYFDPNGITAVTGQDVIVETSKGLEYARCVEGNHEVDDQSILPPLRPVIRVATEDDIKKNTANRAKEKRAFDICLEKIAKHGLDMKLVDVEYNFEGNKILFFFTSDGRVNFRDLVKDLASVLKARIELRQIGVRDEARMLGGLGICGRPFCCTQFLDDFQPVSIKMAKTQGLSLNPTKISGTCGRLMCCLKYEQEAYQELVKNVPKVDAFVETPSGKGSVVDVNLLRGQVRVRIEEQNDTQIRTFPADTVTVLGGKAMRAEFLAARAEEEAKRVRNVPARPRPEHLRRDIKKMPLTTLDEFVSHAEQTAPAGEPAAPAVSELSHTVSAAAENAAPQGTSAPVGTQDSVQHHSRRPRRRHNGGESPDSRPPFQDKPPRIAAPAPFQDKPRTAVPAPFGKDHPVPSAAPEGSPQQPHPHRNHHHRSRGPRPEGQQPSSPANGGPSGPSPQ